MYKIGIDLGGTNIAAGICDENYNIIEKQSVKTNSQRHYTEIIYDMAQLVLSLLEKANIAQTDCESIGIGSPGYCDSANGIVVYSNNIKWENVNIREELSKYFCIPINLANDANCAALGEVIAGDAKNYNDAVMLTLGTGVGGGIIIDKKIFAGNKSAGAELGHSLLVYDGIECTCGRKGCIEMYASASALISQTKIAANQNKDSIINQLCKTSDEIGGKTAFEAMSLGDIVATNVVKQYIDYLSAAVVDFVNIFRPEVVILGGGVCKEGEKLTKPIQDYINKYCYGAKFSPIPELVTASLGNDAGIIGAAFLG